MQYQTRSFFIVALVLIAANAMTVTPSQASDIAGMTDAIDVSVARSESEHRYQSGGRIMEERAGDLVGGHDMRRLTRGVIGVGSWISYQVQVQANSPVTLEIEELENRAAAGKSGDVRAYSVWVDGQRAYFRTGQSSGAGPLHFFVDVPARSKNVLEIKFQNETEAPFHFSRLWAFSNFASYFQKSRMAVPYYLAPTVPLRYDNFEDDLEKLQNLKNSFGTHPHARLAWTTWLTYANNSDRDNAARIAYILRLAQESDLPVQLCFDTWWGSTPGGSDGQGGFWTDVQYQQVVYNSTTGRYELSIPNRWSNTPWLSVGNPRLNAFKARRLQVAVQMLQEQLAATRARGKENLILAVNLDNEPVYWATGNAGLGTDILQADFNPFTVEAARRDKITLDPTDGLDFSERLWLSLHLLGYNEMIGGAAASGAGHDPILVKGTGTYEPSQILRDNIYTQAMVANPVLQYPMQSATYPFWETAAPASVRIGSEWNGNSLREREAVLHQLPLGRTAQINAEAGNKAEEMVGVRPGYGLGLRYYALYNYPLNSIERAGSEIRDTTQPFAPFTYERVLREESFEALGWEQRVVETHGLQRGIIGNTTLQALYPTSNSNEGWLTYRLDAPQNSFEGLNLELSGRAFVSHDRNPQVFIRVLAGTKNEADSMREIGRIFDDGDINAVHKLDVSPVARGQKSVFVRVELHADKLPASVLSWCAVYNLRFTLPWSQSQRQTAFTQDESLETQRQRNLLVSWRRDAELALGRLERLAGEGALSISRRSALDELAIARRAYANGDYATSYGKSSAAENQLLSGVTYRVVETGRLEPYPLSIQTTAPVTITFHGWDEQGIAFDMRGEQATSPLLSFGGLKAGETYALLRNDSQLEDENWELRAARDAKIAPTSLFKADARGIVRCRVNVTAKGETAHEQSVQGTYRELLDKETHQLFGLWRDDANGTERIKLHPQAQILRGEPGHEEPSRLDQFQRGDAVSVQLAADGTATRVVAGTQTLRGTVEQFSPLTPYAMPFVQLTDSPVKHIIDLSAPLMVPDTGGSAIKTNFRSAPLGSINIKRGDTMTLRINPKTGRVFELSRTQSGTP